MSLEITEREMVSRFSESMKEAASCAQVLSREQEQPKPQAFIDFLHAIRVSAGSAHQLYIYRENVYMAMIRDTLEAVIDESTKIAPTFYNSKYWAQIEEALVGIRAKGLKSADEKSMSRNDVLAHLKIRAQNASLDTVH